MNSKHVLSRPLISCIFVIILSTYIVLASFDLTNLLNEDKKIIFISLMYFYFMIGTIYFSFSKNFIKISIWLSFIFLLSISIYGGIYYLNNASEDYLIFIKLYGCDQL